MKRPTWATIIGILTITFGIFGIFGGAQEMVMPSMLEMQKEMMTNFSENKTSKDKEVPTMSLEIEKDGEKQKTDISQMFEGMQDQFKFPEWYKSWAMVIGLISMAIAAIYLLSGIFLLMTKQSAIKIFYIAIGCSIFWAFIQAAIYSQTGSAILMAQIPSSIASVVIDIIFLIVVLVGSKEAFSAEQVNL